MTTATAPAFPIDTLLTCARCQAMIRLGEDPEPRYTCLNSCVPSFRPCELNRLLIREITRVVITESTFPMLKGRFFNTLADAGAADGSPSDDEIRRLVTDPDTFLAEDETSAASKLLGAFIDRIELDARQATIQYALALPSGSNLAGSWSQQVAIPGSVTS